MTVTSTPSTDVATFDGTVGAVVSATTAVDLRRGGAGVAGRVLGDDPVVPGAEGQRAVLVARLVDRGDEVRRAGDEARASAERCTSYSIAPATLSVDAAHVSDAEVGVPSTTKPVGTDGAVTSATTTVSWFDAALALPAASLATTR